MKKMKKKQNGHRLKNFFHHEGHEEKRSLMFTVDPEINFL